MGNYNVEKKKRNRYKSFCNQHKLKYLNEELTCFKKFKNSSYRVLEIA